MFPKVWSNFFLYEFSFKLLVLSHIMSKRKRIFATSLILTAGFIGVQFLDSRFRMPGILGLSLLGIPLFVWSLYEGLGIDMTLSVLVLPFLFTLGVGLFWFLLPVSVYTRIPILVFYGIGIYALALTANIYTVAAIRTIALLRAARGVGFVLALVTSFLIFDAILSVKFPIYLTVLFCFIVSFPIFFHGFWSIVLEKDFSKNILVSSLICSLAVSEVSAALYFWPVTVVVGSIFLTVVIYVLLGLGQAKYEIRLFSQTIKEYLGVGALVFIGMYFATHWGG